MEGFSKLVVDFDVGNPDKLEGMFFADAGVDEFDAVLAVEGKVLHARVVHKAKVLVVSVG